MSSPELLAFIEALKSFIEAEVSARITKALADNNLQQTPSLTNLQLTTLPTPKSPNPNTDSLTSDLDLVSSFY